MRTELKIIIHKILLISSTITIEQDNNKQLLYNDTIDQGHVAQSLRGAITSSTRGRFRLISTGITTSRLGAEYWRAVQESEVDTSHCHHRFWRRYVVQLRHGFRYLWGSETNGCYQPLQRSTAASSIWPSRLAKEQPNGSSWSVQAKLGAVKGVGCLGCRDPQQVLEEGRALRDLCSHNQEGCRQEGQQDEN